jgi:hypothetical protein
MFRPLPNTGRRSRFRWMKAATEIESICSVRADSHHGPGSSAPLRGRKYECSPACLAITSNTSTEHDNGGLDGGAMN